MKETLHIYTRVSTVTQQDEGTSLESQRELGIEKAESLNFNHKVWNEGGASSHYDDFENRPVLLQLLSKIQQGNVKHLWVYNNDRLSRNEITAQTIKTTLKKHSVTLYTENGKFDFNNYQDNFLKTILDGVAQLDNAQRAERTRIGKLNRVKQGFWMGGPAPFGYKTVNKKLILNKDESVWVEKIYQWYADGKPIEWIKSELDKNGVQSRRKKLWSLGSVRKILQNTHPIGYYNYMDKKTEESVQCKCPCIVSKTLWNKCQKRREIIHERKGQINRTKRFYLLRDLLYCGHCGKHMSGRIKEDKNEYLYYCPHRERAWVKSASKGQDKWKRNNGCDMNRSLNIPLTDDFIMKEIGSAIFLSNIRENAYNVYHNHTNDQKNASDSDVSILKLRKKRFEKELERAINNVADLKTEKLLKQQNERVIDGVIDRMNEHIRVTEDKIEKINVEIEQLTNSFKVNPNQVVMNFEHIASEIKELQNKKKMRAFLQSFIEKITVFYDKNKAEHKLVVHMKKSIIGDDKQFVLPSKKNRKRTKTPVLHNTPLLNNHVTVE